MSEHHVLLVTLILLNSEIINPYSYYLKKGLVYIALAAPFSCQPSFYLKYTKVNTQLLYNIYSVPLNEYTSLTVYY
jgi:hypothetical protein